MRSNYWEKPYGITTFGESHSKAVGVVIEDVKPNIDFPLVEIQAALDKRRPGKGKFSSSRQEPDKLEILSGVFNGKTTGMPICLVVYNNDARSNDYQYIKDIFRPEHSDLAYFKKYKIYDYRGGGRSSGRETISRVAAAGLVSNKLKGINIRLYPVKIGKMEILSIDEAFLESNSLYYPCPKTYQQVVDYLEGIKKAHDSVGGIVEVKITNVPAGLGDPVFEKLDANLAKALISIGSVKGIEFGLGFRLACLQGSEANQPLHSIEETDTFSNAGGIYGGITTGEPVTFRFVVKPTPSIGIEQHTVNSKGEKVSIKLQGRYDTCIIPRIIPVAEAMIKLVLADAVSYQDLIEGKDRNLPDYREAIDKLDEDILIALGKRKQLSNRITQLKKEQHLSDYQPQREENILKDLIIKGSSLGLDSELIRSIWKNIFENNRGKRND